MNEEKIIELARSINQILSVEFGEPEGTEYVSPNPGLVAKADAFPPGTTLQEVAEDLAAKILKIMRGEFD